RTGSRFPMATGDPDTRATARSWRRAPPAPREEPPGCACNRTAALGFDSFHPFSYPPQREEMPQMNLDSEPCGKNRMRYEDGANRQSWECRNKPFRGRWFHKRLRHRQFRHRPAADWLRPLGGIEYPDNDSGARSAPHRSMKLDWGAVSNRNGFPWLAE